MPFRFLNIFWQSVFLSISRIKHLFYGLYWKRGHGRLQSTPKPDMLLKIDLVFDLVVFLFAWYLFQIHFVFIPPANYHFIFLVIV
jgi:hypothetical protein